MTERLEIEPPKAYVVQHVRYTYACPSCRDGRQVVTTQKPPQAVEKSPFGASVLAWLVVAKFERHLPVYRYQEMLLGSLKLWLSRTLLCGLLRSTAGALRPLERRIIEHVLQNNVLQVDETLTRFLGKRLGKAAQGYLFGYQAHLQFGDQLVMQLLAEVLTFAIGAIDRRDQGSPVVFRKHF